MELMEKTYDPKDVEPKWYAYWERNRLFHAETHSSKPPYTIVIPPPNVTGILTIGHVLNNTLQDILIRWKRMQGYEALWMPGTDHAGIATQNVVEKELAREGKTRHDLGREAFVERVWAWKEKHGGIIIQQLKQLGCSCDWERERFTMDEGLSKAVQEVFVQLYERGLIYRGKYIISWCPRCQTALSDEESIHREEQGSLWYIRYPIKRQSGYVTVATTRPETMLGDTAVAVHPRDPRYKKLVGKTLILPILGRELPVITDEVVDPRFGTGAVKVTPAHDPNDFEMGKRHGLPQINVMNEDGTMNQEAGPKYSGMDRYACRKALIQDLKALELLEKVERHTYAVGHCQRCDTVIEPYWSDQWFVRMDPLTRPAIRAVKDGTLRFYPERWVKTYLNWLENIRDWCISRQIWWGHRIPVWYCACGQEIVSRETPTVCPFCGSDQLKQDEDVLDTWFSSWLWPFSTMGWPEETDELKQFYPTNDLVTGPDIIFFWVARMVMAGYEFMGSCPFSDVYFTSMVRDLQGRKMSKSLGNSPDPTEVMNTYGADALRFTMTMLSPMGQDVYYANEKVELGRNFANKIWNATRFVLMNMADYDPGRSTWYEPELVDRWIRSRLEKVKRSVHDALCQYRFNDAAYALYEFIWHEYCDWYLEAVKPRLYAAETSVSAGSNGAKIQAQRTMIEVLDQTMRLLHPFMPFLTEEIWQRLSPYLDGRVQSVEHGRNHPNSELRNSNSTAFYSESGAPVSIMVAPWPEQVKENVDEAAEQEMALVQELVTAIRNIRGEMNIPPGKRGHILLRALSEDLLGIVERNQRYIADLANVEEIVWGPDLEKPQTSASAVVEEAEVFLPLEGLINLDLERARLEKEIERLQRQMDTLNKKLSNEAFLRKAPAEVVERERRKQTECATTLEKVRRNLEILSD